MSSAIADYSTEKPSSELMSDIREAIQSVKSYGSIELYIQDGVVTQITVRNIKKTTGTRTITRSR